MQIRYNDGLIVDREISISQALNSFYEDDDIDKISFFDEDNKRIVMSKYWPDGQNGKFVIKFCDLTAEVRRIEVGRWFPTEEWFSEGLYYTPKSIDFLK